jgi:NhaP-type Na+/H+ or K+/H+ antiporter
MSGTEHLDNYVFIGLTAILSLYILIGAYIHAKKCKYLHESLVILLIAAPLAVIFPKVMKSHDHAESEEPYKISPKISPDIIFQYLLPPIIMSAGFNMRKKFFFKNIGYIGLFGFLGTLLNFVIVTVCFSIFNSMIGLDLPTYNNWDITTVMCLSATLIATDTIAPLTLINQTKYPTLFSVVFGEGVSNDAVALLLMNVVLGFKTETNRKLSSYTSYCRVWPGN